jgi:hypothetical protein
MPGPVGTVAPAGGDDKLRMEIPELAESAVPSLRSKGREQGRSDILLGGPPGPNEPLPPEVSRQPKADRGLAPGPQFRPERRVICEGIAGRLAATIVVLPG